MKRICTVLALLLLTSEFTHAEPITGTMLPLRSPGGWAMLSDGITLVVSQPDKGELIYFDTVAEKEAKRVEVDFKPATMALQGDTLYVGSQGASVIYALDVKMGKQKKEILLGGNAVANIACHPTKGRVFATTTTQEVYSIDPASGKATKTTATGHFIVVDPVGGNTVFTAVQPPFDQLEFDIQDLPDGRIKILVDRWGPRAFILKYEVSGDALKMKGSQKNAACNAYSLVIAPDGKKVLVVSGGGWRPPAEGGTGGGYVSAAFSTEKLETMVGQAPGGTRMDFHPVLNLGVVSQQSGRDYQLFNPRSLVGGKTFNVSPGAGGGWITFGAKGTKVILWNGDNPANALEGLHFLPLTLTGEDRAALEKVYGKLPAAVVTRTNPATQSPPTVGTLNLPKSILAQAGFNDAKGMNSDETKDSPYPLGKSKVQGGFRERGWKGVWGASDNAEYVKDVVAEGDGAVLLTSTTNFARALAEPIKGKFGIEVMALAPLDEGGCQCYVWKSNYGETGPMWRIQGGKFKALDGDESGAGSWIDVADCKPDTWHKVTLTIDTEARRWQIAVNDKRTEKQFKFRSRTTQLQEINFLVEGKESVYIDAIKVLVADAKKK